MVAKNVLEVQPALDIQELTITLIGDSPLISHRFGDKNKRSILDKQQKKVAPKQVSRNPEEEYNDALYPIPDVEGAYGFPAMAFKLAAVRGAKAIPDLAMTDARGMFRIDCADHMLIPLKYEDVRMEQDIVRIGRGSTDLRFRPYFYGWEVDLHIKYNASITRPETIIMMFDIAGFGTGVGDWRPEKGGMYGTFHVKKEGE